MLLVAYIMTCPDFDNEQMHNTYFVSVALYGDFVYNLSLW